MGRVEVPLLWPLHLFEISKRLPVCVCVCVYTNVCACVCGSSAEFPTAAKFVGKNRFSCFPLATFAYRKRDYQNAGIFFAIFPIFERRKWKFITN